MLAMKLVEAEGTDSSGNQVKRHRGMISDGKHYYDYAMFLIFTDLTHGSVSQELPQTHSIIRIHNPCEISTGEDVRQNSIKYMKEKAIWIICRYDILRTGGEKMGTPVKIVCQPPSITQQYSTPEHSPRGQNSQQCTPVKRRETSAEEASSSSSVKRALFSTPSNTFQPINSSLYKPSHMIKYLNPFQNKFRIKARVVKKSQLRSWANSRGEGQVFDVILQDSSGDIRATGKTNLAASMD